ncbi:MAG: DUF3047 domain-containing protein [Betaproteobacteria bacterium]|nr:DUF3047 domain-containing protein [Betaproteobacteria bacterium]
MNRRAFLKYFGAGLWIPGLAWAQSSVDVARFSDLRAGDPLPGWLAPYVFENQPRHTQFSLVEDEGRVVLRAEARASTSGLIREMHVDPKAYPILAWRWKVMNLIAKSDLATKAGDDFPARLYVTFDLDPDALPAGQRLKLRIGRYIYGSRLPLAALCYVWDARAPVETIVPNAYTDRVRMVVVDSGPVRLGRWVEHERNLLDDYRKAFGVDPGAVNGVVFSSDTDNTGEDAVAFFGDTWFVPRPSIGRKRNEKP